MNLRQLEVFCTVVRCESFSGAAEQLFLTQPAVSMQVQAVEKYFGVQLLERRSRRVMLTEAGNVVHHWACEVLRSEGETRKLVDELRRAESGRIVVGTSMALGSHVLPRLIHRFKGDHAGAEIVLRLADREEVVQEIVAGTIDVGALIAGEVPHGLEMEVVGTEPMIFIVAPSHKLAHRRRRPTARELADEPFVVAPKGTGYRQITDQFLTGQGIENVRVLMEVGVVESIKGAVQEGIAVGVTLRSAVAWEIEQGWLCEVEPPRGRTMVDLALVYRPHRQVSPMLRAFIDALRVGLSEQTPSPQPLRQAQGRLSPRGSGETQVGRADGRSGLSIASVAPNPGP